jgi:hypothetical protein
MYLRRSTLIQEQESETIISLAIGISCSVLMFQIFTCFLLLETRNFGTQDLYKKLSYTNIF